MKKIFKLFSILALSLIFLVSCSSLKSTMKSFTSVFKSPTKYNNVTVTFVTTQGEITFFLYPEAAPLTVANFINLAKRGFYDNTKFTRSVDNFIVQGGDPTGTGMGGPGYTIPDEFVEWLDFYQPGMLAMANAGPNTGGSQFFFTFAPADWLNGVHTVFGEVRSEGDFQKIRKLEMGDVVKEVKISENGDFILSLFKDQVEQWNSVLDREYPNLKKVGLLYTSSEDNSIKQIEEAKKYAAELGIEVKLASIANTNDIQQVTESLASEVDAIFVPIDNTIASVMATVVKVTDKFKIGVFPSADTMVADGGVLGLGVDQYQIGVETAKVIVDVLNGKKPADTPIVLANEGVIYLNEEKAKELGIEIPENIKAKAQIVK